MTTKNKIFISSLFVFIGLILIACNTNKNNTRFYLTDKYYNIGEVLKLDENEVENLSNESFLLFTYNSYCGMAKPCEEVFDAVLKRYRIDYVSMPVETFRKTKYHDTVKLAPSFLIIKNGEIVAYLDAENDNDLDYYQNEDDFESWLRGYIYLEK